MPCFFMGGIPGNVGRATPPRGRLMTGEGAPCTPPNGRLITGETNCIGCAAGIPDECGCENNGPEPATAQKQASRALIEHPPRITAYTDFTASSERRTPAWWKEEPDVTARKSCWTSASFPRRVPPVEQSASRERICRRGR